MTKRKADIEKRHNVVELQRIMNCENVARNDLDATVGDHVLQHKQVHTSIARWRPFYVLVIIRACHIQQEILCGHLKNGLVNWAHMLGPNNCRALLREGINCQMFKELADLSQQDSKIPLQHCILRKPDWVLLSNVATCVVTVEAAILMLVIHCLIMFSSRTVNSFSILVFAASELAEAVHGSIHYAIYFVRVHA